MRGSHSSSTTQTPLLPSPGKRLLPSPHPPHSVFPVPLSPASHSLPPPTVGIPWVPLSWHRSTDGSHLLVFLGREALGTRAGVDFSGSPEASLRVCRLHA